MCLHLDWNNKTKPNLNKKYAYLSVYVHTLQLKSNHIISKLATWKKAELCHLAQTRHDMYAKKPVLFVL